MDTGLPTFDTLIAVGLAGVAVFAAVVVIDDGVEARLLLLAKAKVVKPPRDFFWNNTEARVAVTIQVKSEPVAELAAGTVNNWPENVPKVPVLPVKAELASLQLTAVSAQFELGTAMLTVIAVPTVDTLIGAGDAGVAVPIVLVVIALGVVARFVAADGENVPVPPNEITCNLKTVLYTLTVQAILLAIAVAVVSKDKAPVE